MSSCFDLTRVMSDTNVKQRYQLNILKHIRKWIRKTSHKIKSQQVTLQESDGSVANPLEPPTALVPACRTVEQIENEKKEKDKMDPYIALIHMLVPFSIPCGKSNGASNQLSRST